MNGELILFWLLLFPFSMYCQADLLNSEYCDTLIFNSVEKVDEETWVNEYDFWDRIDTIQYKEKERSGYISSYNRRNQLIEREVYKHDGLSIPRLEYYSSFFEIKEGNIRKKYYGQRFDFLDYFLVTREIFYESGQLKSIEEFRYGKTECIIVLFDPISYEPIEIKEECMDRMKSGIWKWFDESGNLVKEENFIKD